MLIEDYAQGWNYRNLFAAVLCPVLWRDNMRAPHATVNAQALPVIILPLQTANFAQPQPRESCDRHHGSSSPLKGGNHRKNFLEGICIAFRLGFPSFHLHALYRVQLN